MNASFSRHSKNKDKWKKIACARYESFVFKAQPKQIYKYKQLWVKACVKYESFVFKAQPKQIYKYKQLWVNF